MGVAIVLQRFIISRSGRRYDLVKGGHEVLHELLLRIGAGVDLLQGSQFRVGAEDQIDLRAGSGADRKALAEVEKKLKEIINPIKDGGYSRPLMMRLRELKAKQDELRSGCRGRRWTSRTFTRTSLAFFAGRLSALPRLYSARKSGPRRPRLSDALISTASRSRPAPAR